MASGNDPSIAELEMMAIFAGLPGEGSKDEPNGTAETTAETKREAIKRVDQVWNMNKRIFEYLDTGKERDGNGTFGRYVVTVTRVFDYKGRFSGQHKVTIRAPHVRDVLYERYRDVDDVLFPEAEKLSLEENEIKLLFHARPALEEALHDARSEDEPDEVKVFELESMLEFINDHFGSAIAKIKELGTNLVDFAHLWTLFPPRLLIHGVDELGQQRAYRVRSCEYKKQQDCTKNFLLRADYIDSDGVSVGYVEPRLLSEIKQFAGLKSLFDLPYSPLDRQQDTARVRAELLKRGEVTLQLQAKRLWEYKGHALAEENDERMSRSKQTETSHLDLVNKLLSRFMPSSDNGNDTTGGGSKKRKFNSHGRVMIDPIAYKEMVPNTKIVPNIHTPLDKSVLDETHKILMNPLAYGFNFGDKTWGAFAISKLTDVVWTENIVDSLVLNGDRKLFIQDLIRHHGSRQVNQKGFDDVVRDKGKGLVGLLSGPPGVGKTLTAEAMAEMAHRPLYVISSGELGEDSLSVQERLSAILEIAETWKAVVLLDEADVFLSKRDDQNLARNAITSVFLRLIEYYRGILLLTTNRLTSLDDAFQSRLHFCFEYEDLNEAARASIWKTFLAKVNTDTTANIELADAEIDELAKLNLNGRQIKNIVSIAQAVAFERGQTITLDFIKLATGFARN